MSHPPPLLRLHGTLPRPHFQFHGEGEAVEQNGMCGFEFASFGTVQVSAEKNRSGVKEVSCAPHGEGRGASPWQIFPFASFDNADQKWLQTGCMVHLYQPSSLTYLSCVVQQATALMGDIRLEKVKQTEAAKRRAAEAAREEVNKVFLQKADQQHGRSRSSAMVWRIEALDNKGGAATASRMFRLCHVNSGRYMAAMVMAPSKASAVAARGKKVRAPRRNAMTPLEAALTIQRVYRSFRSISHLLSQLMQQLRDGSSEGREMAMKMKTIQAKEKIRKQRVETILTPLIARKDAIVNICVVSAS